MPWIRTALEKELKDKIKICHTNENAHLLIIWSNEEPLAIENQCSHAFKPLHEGEVINGIIECPYHGGRFCLKTGDHLSPPAFKGIRTYPTRIVDGHIEVLITEY